VAFLGNEATLHGLLKNELGLFRHLLVKLEDYQLPLTWWKSHEIQFPNVFFITRQIFRILGSQIEIEQHLDAFVIWAFRWILGSQIEIEQHLIILKCNIRSRRNTSSS
jgi:hypothetical protein